MREGGSLETATGPNPDPSSLSFQLNNLQSFTTYTVFVTAVNRAGNSTTTGSVVFKTAGGSLMSHDVHNVLNVT